MYRFSIKDEDWILRFSPQISIDADEKQAILLSLLHIGENLSDFSHGNSFMVINKKIGAIIFEVETIPSFILTVLSIIPKEHWYIQDAAIKIVE
jgi:hypothetical protein